MLNRFPNAISVHLYDSVNHLEELCEIGAKTKRESGKSANTATTCSRNYFILSFSDII